MFNIAAIQYHPDKNNISANIREINILLKNAIAQKAKIITLPEMCTTGYVYDSPAEISKYAESCDGQTFKYFSEFCRQNDCYISYGFAENDNGKLYNSLNFINNKGELIINYRKVHLYEADENWALPGDKGFLCCDTEFGRIGFGICMDLNFDDFIIYQLLNKIDILLISNSWLEEHLPVHPYWIARLSPFMGTAVIANNYGYDKGIQFCGRSVIINKLRILCNADNTRNQIIITTL